MHLNFFLLDRLLELALGLRLLFFLFDLSVVSFGFEFFFQVGEFFFLSGRMVEMAAVSLAAVAFHVEGTLLPVLFDVNEGTVVLATGSFLEISTHLSPLH